MTDKIFGNIKEGLNEKKPMYEELKENLLNNNYSNDDKELMEEAFKTINSLETTLRCAIETINVAREQRDKAYQALIKTTKLQHEVEEKLEKAIKAIKTMRDGSDAVMLHTAREILEELEGYKE